MSDSDILRLDGIGHSFAGLNVLRHVTFTVPDHGLVGLIGPNGSGKTTLFNVISGYLQIQQGTITYRDQVLMKRSVQDRSNAGLVRTFQTPKVFENMTVIENIMVGCCKHTRTSITQDLFRTPRSRQELRTIRERADKACSKFALNPLRDELAKKLTAGQRRIVEIARAVVGEPRLLMLDEPSSGLNSEEIDNLRGWITQLRKEGISILLVSHDMELMTVTDIVHVLNFGEIIASGAMADIQQNARVREVYLGV